MISNEDNNSKLTVSNNNNTKKLPEKTQEVTKTEEAIMVDDMLKELGLE